MTNVETSTFVREPTRNYRTRAPGEPCGINARTDRPKGGVGVDRRTEGQVTR